jgi:thiol-disulfide isomerase/thioredoxin
MVLVRSPHMGSRFAIGTGLLAGILVGGLAIGAAVALLPPPTAPVIATPSPLAVANPTPAPTATPSPTASAAPSASPSAVTSPTQSASASGVQDFGIGQVAPNLKLPKAGGGTVNLLALRGKPVWVNFMATWCPECRDELPLMEGFLARYAKTGLTIVLVDVKESSSDVQAYLKGLGVALPAALDSTGSAAAAWKALALPMHFWLTSEGVIAAGAVGAVPAGQMAANLQRILPGVTVKP